MIRACHLEAKPETGKPAIPALPTGNRSEKAITPMEFYGIRRRSNLRRAGNMEVTNYASYKYRFKVE